MTAADHTPRHRGEPKPEIKHRPKPDGSCSLLCNCPTPLTEDEFRLLDEMGIY